MMLWLVLALMTAAAMCAVGWPLARAGRKPKSGSDLAVYRDQLDEISRDQAAGFIGEAEAQAASIEVSRRLLAAADAQTRPIKVSMIAQAAAGDCELLQNRALGGGRHSLSAHHRRTVHAEFVGRDSE